MAKGPVNYTVVGNPTIVDGVASGFSTSNYLRLPKLPGQVSEYFTVRYPFVEQIAFNSGNSNIVGYLLYGNMSAIVYTNGNNRYIQLVFNNGNDAIYVNGNVVIQDNTDYVLRISFDGSKVISEIKQGSGSFVQDAISNEIVTFISDYEFIGVRPASAGSEFGNSIDLKSTYIMVNGQPWFGDCPVEVKKHQIMGPVGYEVVGSPTIVDGVASGFSQNDYSLINSSINIKNITETMFKLYIDTSTIVEDFLNFFLLQDGIRAQYYFNKNLDYGVNMKIYVAGAGHTSTSRNIPTDTWFYLKTTYDGTTYKAFKSLDKNTWEQLMSFDVDLSSEEDTTSFRIGSNPTQSANYFRGSVDLNETYIKENNELWFYQPAPTKYIIREDKNTHEQKLVFADQSMYLTGPVNYTVVGNPTIVDNVASGFSVSNYLQTITPNNDISNLEFNVKINNFSHQNDNVIFKGDYSYQGFLINPEDKFRFVVYAPNETNVWQDVVCNYALTPGNGYIVNFALNNNTYTYNVYSLDKTLLHTQTGTFNFPWFSSSTLSIGAGAGWGYFDGSINFNETYIKVNGNLLFYGKNYASQNIAPVPSGFTYGTTTTPSIGYVDMRTQVFTAAPTGSTIGRDE